MEIVATEKVVVATWPNSWWPFNDREDLEYVDKQTLKVKRANGFSAEGELVHYDFAKNGSIKSIRYCGQTMWPESKYLTMIKKKKTIIVD